MWDHSIVRSSCAMLNFAPSATQRMRALPALERAESCCYPVWQRGWAVMKSPLPGCKVMAMCSAALTPFLPPICDHNTAAHLIMRYQSGHASMAGNIIAPQPSADLAFDTVSSRCFVFVGLTCAPAMHRSLGLKACARLGTS